MRLSELTIPPGTLTEERLGLRSNHICKDTTDKLWLPKSERKGSCHGKLPLPSLMLGRIFKDEETFIQSENLLC